MLKKSQQGISMIGLMLLAPIVAVLLLVAIKLTPIYVEHATVGSVLKSMSGERTETYSTPIQVRDAFFKRISINEINGIHNDDITVERQGGVFTISVDYEVRVPLFYNLSMVVAFSNQGEVPAL